MTTMMSGWKIMIYQLVPCRGGTETFAHATETKPWWINFPFNVHHRRLIWASCIGESIFRSKKFWSLRQNLRRAAVVIASAIVIGIASVLKQRSSIQRWILAPSSSWHHHLHLILTVIIIWEWGICSCDKQRHSRPKTCFTWHWTPRINTEISATGRNIIYLNEH